MSKRANEPLVQTFRCNYLRVKVASKLNSPFDLPKVLPDSDLELAMENILGGINAIRRNQMIRLKRILRD